METHFIGVPSSIVKAALADLGSWHVLGERFKARSIEMCPVSRTVEQGGTSTTSGSLKRSMEVRYEMGLDARILVGSTLTRDGGVSALGLILEGTEAHGIDPVNAKALRFTDNGQITFAAHVEHPGTKKNPFVQRAIRSVILESVSVI